MGVVVVVVVVMVLPVGGSPIGSARVKGRRKAKQMIESRRIF